MPTLSEIEQLSAQLAAAYHPHRIVLFGSFARGNPRIDSDVDLLVAMDGLPTGPEAAALMIETLKPRFSVDLIVKSSEEISRRLAQQDYFLQQVHREGRILYEAAHA